MGWGEREWRKKSRKIGWVRDYTHNKNSSFCPRCCPSLILLSLAHAISWDQFLFLFFEGKTTDWANAALSKAGFGCQGQVELFRQGQGRGEVGGGGGGDLVVIPQWV